MSEEKIVKPKIEDVAAGFLNEGDLENLKDFVGFLKENKLTPTKISGGTWVVKNKGKTVCHMRLWNEKDWGVTHSHFTREKWFKDYDKYITDDGLITFIHNHIRKPACPKDCWSYKNKMTILGKQFDPVCNCEPLRLTNPSGTELENEKKLVLVIKNISLI